MKRQLMALTLCAVLASIVGFGAQTSLFDLEKSHQEIEIMRGILSKTLDFAQREIRGKAAPTGGVSGGVAGGTGAAVYLGEAYGSSGITGYYLYGQGATFTVPISGRFGSTGLEMAFVGKMDEYGMQRLLERSTDAAVRSYSREVERASREMALASEEIARSAHEAAKAATEALQHELEIKEYAKAAGQPKGPSPAPQAVPAPPAPPAPPAKPSAEELKKLQEKSQQKLAEAKEKMRQKKEQLEAARKKLEENLPLLKGRLIEALANHGDSLTQVKPNEYINIVLKLDNEIGGFQLGGDEMRGRRDVLSVQKSVISDYKAGRLNLESFRQKVLQYSN